MNTVQRKAKDQAGSDSKNQSQKQMECLVFICVIIRVT